MAETKNTKGLFGGLLINPFGGGVLLQGSLLSRNIKILKIHAFFAVIHTFLTISISSPSFCCSMISLLEKRLQTGLSFPNGVNQATRSSVQCSLSNVVTIILEPHPIVESL